MNNLVLIENIWIFLALLIMQIIKFYERKHLKTIIFQTILFSKNTEFLDFPFYNRLWDVFKTIDYLIRRIEI